MASTSEGGIKVNRGRFVRKPGLDDVSIVHRVTEVALPIKLDVHWDLWQEEGTSPEEMIEYAKVFGQVQHLMGTGGVQPFALHILKVDFHCVRREEVVMIKEIQGYPFTYISLVGPISPIPDLFAAL